MKVGVILLLVELRTIKGSVKKGVERIMNASFEFAGFIIGVIGAIWLKVSMDLMRREKSQDMKLPAVEEDPAVTAFIKGLSLILIGLGMETFARVFLN